MITKKEFIKKAMHNAIKEYIRTVLLSNEYSDKFVAKSDKKKFEAELEKISEDVIDILVGKLNDKEPTKQEFEILLIKSIDEYFGDKGGTKNNSK